MNANIEFGKLWAAQTVPVAMQEEVLMRVKHFKVMRIRQLVLNGLFLLVSILLIAGIWIVFEPQQATTKWGMSILITVITVYLISQGKVISLYLHLDNATSNEEFLMRSIRIKEREARIQSGLIRAYFIFLSIGIGLYMFEFLVDLHYAKILLIYVAVYAWIGFIWRFARPRLVLQQRQRLDEVVGELSRLVDQWKS